MYKNWYDVFPEIAMIGDKDLQKKVVEHLSRSFGNRRMVLGRC